MALHAPPYDDARRRAHAWIFCAVCCSVALPGCAPERPSDRASRLQAEVAAPERPGAQRTVLVVDGESIDRATFERSLDELPAWVRSRYASTDKRKELLDELASFEVMADEAERRPELRRSPMVRAAMADKIARHTERQLLRERLGDAPVDDPAIEDYYREHRDRYRTPARYRIGVIVFEGEEAARRRRAELLEQLAAPAGLGPRVRAFQVMAQRYSLHRSSGRRGGLLSPLVDGRVEGPRADDLAVAEALEAPGDLSEPYRTARGWQLAMLLERTPAEVRPLEEVRDRVRRDLVDERARRAREEILAKLREESTVEIHEEALSNVEAPAQTDTSRPEPTRDSEDPTP
jgi:hypothetical protein